MLPPINTWTFGKERKCGALGNYKMDEYQEILNHVAPVRTEKRAKHEFLQKLRQLPIPRLRLYGDSVGLNYVPPPLRLPRVSPPPPALATGDNSSGKQAAGKQQTTSPRDRLQASLSVQRREEEEYHRLKGMLLPVIQVSVVSMLDNMAKEATTKRHSRRRKRKSTGVIERDEAAAILVNYYRRCKESLRRDGRLSKL